MGKSMKDAIMHRRSYYSISKVSPVSDTKIEEIVKFAIKNVPSAYNSQSTRIVLLLGDNHDKFWDITLNVLKKIVPEEAHPATEKKINSFASGYGTVLFFEDSDVVKSLQSSFPLYADNFSVWSQHTSAMHQFTVWTMLEDVGFGASLQHYNPLIDMYVYNEWSIPENWKLIAQMPFGTPTAEPTIKTYQQLKNRMLVFK